MLSSKARGLARGVVDPLARALARIGVTADGLTLLGLAGSLVAGGVAAAGHPRLGGLLLLLAAVPDMLDGAVARLSGSSGPRGAFLDSVADRLSDAAVLVGLVWLGVSTDQPRVALLAAVVLALGLTVSYVKARAQSLGFSCDVGIAERPERVILLALTLLTGLLEVGLWVLAVLSALTVAQRVATVWRQAGRAG